MIKIKTGHSMKAFLIYIFTCSVISTYMTAISSVDAQLFTLGFFEGYHEELGIQNVIPCVNIEETKVVQLREIIKEINSTEEKFSIDQLKNILEYILDKIKLCKGVQVDIKVFDKPERLFEDSMNFLKKCQRIRYAKNRGIYSVVGYAQMMERSNDLGEFGYVMGRILGYTSTLRPKKFQPVFGILVEFE